MLTVVSLQSIFFFLVFFVFFFLFYHLTLSIHTRQKIYIRLVHFVHIRMMHTQTSDSMNDHKDNTRKKASFYFFFSVHFYLSNNKNKKRKKKQFQRTERVGRVDGKSQIKWFGEGENVHIMIISNAICALWW